VLIYYSYKIIGNKFRVYFSIAIGVLLFSLTVLSQMESSTILPT
jgi:uncharacterized membrane protein